MCGRLLVLLIVFIVLVALAIAYGAGWTMRGRGGWRGGAPPTDDELLKSIDNNLALLDPKVAERAETLAAFTKKFKTIKDHIVHWQSAYRRERAKYDKYLLDNNMDANAQKPPWETS